MKVEILAAEPLPIITLVPEGPTERALLALILQTAREKGATTTLRGLVHTGGPYTDLYGIKWNIPSETLGVASVSVECDHVPRSYDLVSGSFRCACGAAKVPSAYWRESERL